MLDIGNAPLSWGVFEGLSHSNPPWPMVLDEIAEAGYRRVELGPVGFLPEEPAALRRELDRRGLKLTAGFLYEHIHDPTQRPEILDTARRVCHVLSEMAASRLVIIDRMTPERQLTAGRSDRARRLTRPEWQATVEMVVEVAELASATYGLRPVLHPHCGGFIEFEDEIERALTDLPNDVIGLCIDTGHAAVASLQAKDLVSKYPERVDHFHFKDVDGSALATLVQSEMTFDEGLSRGLFCPLGLGVVDFVGLREALEEIQYDGSATVEQDPDPTSTDHSGLREARQSLSYLESIGLALPRAEAGAAATSNSRRGDQHDQ